jgi:signal transduction histidine kinase
MVAPGVPNVALLVLMMTAVAVSVAGARLVERYREASFAAAWRQERLLGLARELAQHVEVEEIVDRVLGLGMPALAADRAALALRDPRRGVYRVEVHADDVSGSAEWWSGLEIPQDYAPLQAIVERGMLEIPADEPASELLPVLAAQQVRHVLCVAMRHGQESVGVLCFVRLEDVPFDASERQVARGFADQVALAIRTAGVVGDLQRANRLKSEFVSTMSHELRTPLNVILGFTDMLGDPMFGHTERQEFTRHIRNAGLELLELIENTLAVGKLDVGREDIQLERLSLRAFWTEVGRTCGDLPHAPGVAFEWSDTVPDVDFRTDPRKLATVVRNLVGNALKFTSRGRVRCDAWVAGDNLVIRVSDTGIGIHAEDHQAIFEMFRQADSSDSRRFGGTGLGLYIVRRYVGQLGGRVTLESALGVGSVFSVILPRSSASYSEAA